VQALRERGAPVVLGTVTWSFAARFIQREYAFHAHCGTVMAEVGGVLSGTIQQYFDEYKKAELVTQLCRAQRVPLERCVALGDSRSVIPLFRRAGLAIALNASEAARAAAHVHDESLGLRSVLPFLDVLSWAS
jgi:phosphoserine phosphatase